MDKELKEQRVDQLPVAKESVLEEVASRIESQSETRRRFIKKAIATAPVILTVTAGPVWAKVRNCTPSGRLSGNLSKQEGLPCCGCSPGYWRNLIKRGQPWPIPHDDLWTDHFAPGGPLDTYTLLAILQNEPRIPSRKYKQFGRHAVAAYLNSIQAPNWDCNFGYSTIKVLNMVDNAYMFGDDSKMEQVKDILEILNTSNEDMC